MTHASKTNFHKENYVELQNKNVECATLMITTVKSVVLTRLDL